MTAPKVTQQDIDAAIAGEFYFTAQEGVLADKKAGWENSIFFPELGLLTFCVLVLQNGFTVTGESACVSPENFDFELGKKIARQKAVEKVWPLLGYALKDSLIRPK
jgi:hypothetical protein